MYESVEKGGETTRDPTMSNDKYETISDVDLTLGHFRFLREAGASDEMLDMVKAKPGLAGISRNSCKQEVKKYVFWESLEGDPEDFTPMGGHFFSALWDGNLFDAWRRADLNNKSLMLEIYGESRIIADGITRGHPTDYAERMVTEPAL
jgi:hypothetical protein